MIITGCICKEHLSAHFGKNYSVFTLTQKPRKIQYVLHILFLLLATAISSRAFMWRFPARCLVFHNCNRDLTQELKYTCFRIFFFFKPEYMRGQKCVDSQTLHTLIVEKPLALMLNVLLWQNVLGWAVGFHSATRALVKSQWCILLHNTWAKQILLSIFYPAVPSSHFSVYTSLIPFLTKEETRGERSQGNSLFSLSWSVRNVNWIWHVTSISMRCWKVFMMDCSSWILIIMKLCSLSHIFFSWPNSYCPVTLLLVHSPEFGNHRSKIFSAVVFKNSHKWNQRGRGQTFQTSPEPRVRRQQCPYTFGRRWRWPHASRLSVCVAGGGDRGLPAVSWIGTRVPDLQRNPQHAAERRRGIDGAERDLPLNRHSDGIVGIGEREKRERGWTLV